MSSPILSDFLRQGLIRPPEWLPDRTIFLGYTGSVAYGASGNLSDMDCVGVCIPPKELVFPYSSTDNILGFGEPFQRFRTWQQHHVKLNEKEYDLNIYNIVDFFHLAMENNPNIVDVLFLPTRCVLERSEIWNHIYANRKIFLHCGSYHKFRGYAYAQMGNIKKKTNSSNPKRSTLITEFGYDTKFAMHVVRLALEAEQILALGDLDLEANSEILKTVRNGGFSLEELEAWFQTQEKKLELLYAESKLQKSPNQKAIRQILLDCLEMAYGKFSVSETKNEGDFSGLYRDMRAVLNRYAQN